jgi:autotransporter-associated beta strand protein
MIAGGAVVVISATAGTVGSVTDNTNGTYTATWTSPTSVGSGTATVTATLDGTAVGTAVGASNCVITLTLGAVNAAHSTVSPATATKTADGASTQVITVRARDVANNNRTSGGDTVVCFATTGTVSSVTDVGDGTYTATWTAPTSVGSGTATITATLGGTPVGTAVGASNCVVTLTVGAVDASHSTVSPATSFKKANGTNTQIITVQARDVYNNNRTSGGDTVGFSATAGTISGVTDNTNGTYTATWTAPASAGSGSATVTATLGGTAIGTAVGASSCVITLTPFDYTWDGTTNLWNSAHWLPDLVAGPTGNNPATSVGIPSGTVTFSGTDTFGAASNITNSPSVTINSATLASGGRFNTMWHVNMNNGTLLANGGVNASFGAFQLAGTLTATGTNQINLGSGSFNTVNISGEGNAILTVSTPDVSDILTVNAVLQNYWGTGNMLKSGLGTLKLAASNTYTGATTVNAGTLALGANNVLPDSSAVSIGNGTLDAATFTDTLGTLDVTSTNATIYLGAGARLAFADSRAIDWTGGRLNITGNFISGSSLRFGTNSNGLTPAQLNLISRGPITRFSLNSSGYLYEVQGTCFMFL